ncbi:putative fatty acid oxidation complex trifunctional enzyme [Pseudolycoriella hygida]|uniref:peptidylprolyl isomerase n=1 Tax=Pseudolycoriella hygida TaxID=35572 RepID=A0A9Q0S6A4_9DIPT|nr:putative fatty acid oxidation complex trifunctional enzyme [Pseudolycoriella hygida]
MTQTTIDKVCVIGSGVMGSAIAALIANSSCQVVLLDIVSNDPGGRNAILKKAMENLKHQRPDPLSHFSKLDFIKIGNLEDDLQLISECDIIIEAVVEKIEVKHQLYNKIIPYLKDNAILASNTSTIPLKKLKAGMADSIKSRFIITHFFNPPRYMELLELVLDSEVNSAIIDKIAKFLTINLGKTIIKSNDTPGFIANRIGCYLLELVVRKAIKDDLNPVIIDKIFTNLFKLPNTGIFGLYDLIGHDVMKLISSSLVKSLPTHDNYQEIYLPTLLLDKMLEKNLIGRKGDGGFYRISVVGGVKTKEVIDFSDFTYKPLKDYDMEYNSINELLESSSIYGQFFQDILVKFYLYLIGLIPTVTDNIYDINKAMKLGYSWKIGPVELLYQLKEGFEWIKNQALLKNLPLPPYITNNSYKLIEASKFQFNRINLEESRILLKNNSAELYLYQNRLVVSITTKMNCLNEEVFDLIIQVVELAEERGQDLYIIPLTDYFSAGADLKLIARHIKNNDFVKLEEFLALGQRTMTRLKYSNVNIISCAVGFALGGGCEILLHSDFIVANQELSTGLVEVSIGLAPGFGGIKEMFYRADEENKAKPTITTDGNNNTSLEPQQDKAELTGNFLEKSISKIVINSLKTEQGRLFFENLLQSSNRSISQNDYIIEVNRDLVGTLFKINSFGEGSIGPATCGHVVTIKYQILDTNNNLINEATKTFSLGSWPIIPAIDMITNGMMVGQSRQAVIPPQYAYYNSKYRVENIDHDAYYKVNIMLNSILPNNFVNPAEVKIFDNEIAYKIPLLCGDKVKFAAKITRLSNGEILYDSNKQDKNIEMKIGDINYPLIVSYALHGKVPVGTRTVIAKGKTFKALGSKVNHMLVQDKIEVDEFLMLELSIVD